MTLAKEDLVAICDVINEAYDELFELRFTDHDDRFNRQTLKLRSIKNGLGDMNSKVDAGLFLYDEFQIMARQAGITLPR